MKYKWLNKKNNNKIIVFFNGWGMDESVIQHLSCDSNDLVMFYDYNSLKTDFDFKLLDLYSEKILIGWSMGVMIATLFDINYDKKIAINGTLKPIDDKYGIPVKIYDLTEKNFSPHGLQRFIKNMFEEEFAIPQIKRDFENQKSELTALKSYKANENFKYDKIIISSNDKIIPTKNQSAFWNIEPNISSGHSPFHHFTSWDEVIYE